MLKQFNTSATLFWLSATCLLAAPKSMAAESESLLNLRLAHHSNVPNAADRENRFSDRLAMLDYRKDWRFIAAPGNWFGAGLIAQADLYQHTSGLNRAAAGVSASYSHKFGLGLQAPRVTFRSQLLYQHFEGNVRSGLTHSHAVTLSRWLTDRVLVSANWSLTDRNAPGRSQLQANPAFQSNVFDQTQQQLNLQVDYLLVNGQALSLTASHTDGDIGASARPGTALRQIASAIAQDNGIDRSYLAYRVDTTTHSAGLQWSVPLSDESSLTAGAERRLARARAGVRYQETRFHIDYLMRF